MLIDLLASVGDPLPLH